MPSGTEISIAHRQKIKKVTGFQQRRRRRRRDRASALASLAGAGVCGNVSYRAPAGRSSRRYVEDGDAGRHAGHADKDRHNLPTCHANHREGLIDVRQAVEGNVVLVIARVGM